MEVTCFSVYCALTDLIFLCIDSDHELMVVELPFLSDKRNLLIKMPLSLHVCTLCGLTVSNMCFLF